MENPIIREYTMIDTLVKRPTMGNPLNLWPTTGNRPLRNAEGTFSVLWPPKGNRPMGHTVGNTHLKNARGRRTKASATAGWESR